MASLVNNLRTFLNAHSEIVQVDPIQGQEMVLDRAAISDMLQRVEERLPSSTCCCCVLFSPLPEYQVRMPRRATLQSSTDIKAAEDLLTFPAGTADCAWLV